jgi:hypothetical protein
MPFGAILGLASAGFQFALGSQQNKIAQQELALKRRALRDQRDQATLNYGLGLDQLRREREQERYNRQIREENAAFARQEYDERKRQYEKRLEVALSEREYMIDRQVKADKDAAKQQEFMIEQYLRNTQLAEKERAFAIEQLEIARATAAGERDEDLQRRAREDMQAQLEREFAIDEMRRAQDIASTERQDDILFRDDIIARLDDMSDEISLAYEEMGPLMAPDLLGKEEFDEILALYENNAMANVDRAADRVASQNEAALQTRGLSNSSIGQSARGDIAGRLSQEYENARLGAVRRAIEYINGVNAPELQKFEAMKDARATRAEEIMRLTDPTVRAMVNLQGVGSANDYSAPVPIGSGLSVRDIRSANSYQAPVAVNSATFAQSGIGQGISNFTTPSVADAYVFDAGTQAINPAQWSVSNPASYFSTAASLQSGIAGQYNPAPYMQSANNMFNGAVGSLGGAAGALDSWMQNRGHSWSARPTTQAGFGSRVPIPRGNPMRF